VSETTVEAPVPAADERDSRWTRLGRRTVRPPIYAEHQYLVVIGFVVLVALVAPHIATSRSKQFLIDLWLVYAIAGIGFYWVFALAGRFAFCQTFMMTLGGFMSAWVTRSGHGKPFLLGVASAIAITSLLAFVVGIIARRSQELYFAIATLAVTSIGADVFNHWDAFSGRNGTVTNVASPKLFGHAFLKDKQVFWLFLGALTIVLLLAVLIERSPFRRDAIASRDNLLVARLTGVAAGRHQLVLFILGSALGGLSGSMYAHWAGNVSTGTFGIDLAIGIFLMLFLGGVGSMWGPVLGAAFYVAIPQVLSNIQKYSSIVYGALLLVVVMALPRGLVGLAQDGSRVVKDQVRKARRKDIVDVAG